MLLQIKKKRGVSVMMEYVMLVSFILAMSTLVYLWMKTNVPTETIACPDGVSIFITNLQCNGSNLAITIRNNGRFNIDGYFIHATTNQTKEIATEDLSTHQRINNSWIKYGNGVLFGVGSNDILRTNEEKTTITGLNKKIYSVEISPLIIREENNKRNIVNCKDARITEKIECG